MLACPPYKLTQKIRIRYEDRAFNKGWIPVLEDEATLSCMCLLLIKEGGELGYNNGKYLINEKLESENLEDIICEGLFDTWKSDQSSSVSKNS
jgi:hypothetical protein